MAASRAGRTGRQSLGRPGRHTVWVHSSVIALLLAGLAGCSGGTTPTGETPLRAEQSPQPTELSPPAGQPQQRAL
ncbi:hypothetical protein [Arthrobacter ulcerisalmonis]|uniref:hypothetical protein n=1 Tax=Arthrobacter ulcerisalmonis TaxID=2483813 RepID=UPI0036720465